MTLGESNHTIQYTTLHSQFNFLDNSLDPFSSQILIFLFINMPFSIYSCLDYMLNLLLKNDSICRPWGEDEDENENENENDTDTEN